MSLFRSTVCKTLLLALAVVIVPACGTDNEKRHPVLMDVRPLTLASGVPLRPLILLKFDQGMDDSTINTTNITINLVSNGTPFGGNWNVTHFPGSFQVVVTPQVPLAANTQYDVLLFPQIEALNGQNLIAPALGGVATRFTTVTPGNTFFPAFNTPTAAGGATGTVVISWTQAQENAANISADYDIYLATATRSQDFFSAPFATTTSTSGITLGTGGANGTLSAGTTYFFVVVCRDNAGNVTVTPEFSATATP